MSISLPDIIKEPRIVSGKIREATIIIDPAVVANQSLDYEHPFKKEALGSVGSAGNRQSRRKRGSIDKVFVKRQLSFDNTGGLSVARVNNLIGEEKVGSNFLPSFTSITLGQN